MKTLHVIQNIPSPYRLHLFEAMNRILQTRGVEFHVHFMSDFSRGHEDRPKFWHNPKMDFPHTYWPDYGYGSHHFNPGMISFLRKKQPDVVLVGCPFDTFTSIWAAIRLKRTSLCAWTEGNTKTTGVMTGWKGWFKRFVFSRFPSVAVPGVQGRKYVALHQSYTKRKMPDCLTLPNLVDEKRFRPRTEWPRSEVEQMRKIMGGSATDKICLIPARLEWCKGLAEFLRAIPSLDSLEGWKIVIMGQGSLKDLILKTIKERQFDSVASILEYVPYADMPKYYAAADLFLLPSLHDHNPLTVVEALHSGLPIALSEMAGNVDEAVTPGRNGWVLPVKDRLLYSEVLSEVFSTSLAKLREMGRLSKAENATFWNTPTAISNFLKGLGI